MNRREFLRSSTAVAGLFATTPLWLCSRGEAKQSCYRPGNEVDPSVFFLDPKGRLVTLGDQVDESTKVLYLLIFGGAYAKKKPDERGRLWCGDSSDDMAVHRTVYFNYAGEGVTFVPVAAPPVYSTGYGFKEDVFLTEPESSAAYQNSLAEFIEKTEVLKKDGTLPFDSIFYDPRFRLLDNSNEHEHVPAYGSIYPWQGRFKWSEDEQRYGTPTIWLLDGRLRVIRTPFWGNVYEGVPVQINYTVRDVIRALDEALEATE